VLGDFRAWLYEAAARGDVPAPPAAPEPPDLHTLLGQMAALRHDVNLQTKAARAQQEQNAETLRELGRALDAATAVEPTRADSDENLRPIIKVMLDIADALNLARREFTRGRASLDDSLRALSAPPPRSWLGRILGRPAPPPDTRRLVAMIDSLVTGYTMSVQRVERALPQLGLERIDCVGRGFDPETMEAVEVVADSGRPAGEVVEELRPGYRWRGKLFRFAQVSVSQPRGVKN
jgi:molecular chaperone GrpE